MKLTKSYSVLLPVSKQKLNKLHLTKNTILATQMDAKSGNPDATVNLRFPNLLGRGEQLKENAPNIAS